MNDAPATWPYPRVLAHRGGGALAPENTLAAIRIGLERGFRAVEFDAMLAADGVPVLMHDPRLDRTGMIDGAVSELSAAQLEQIDVGRWHSERFVGEMVPTLERTLHFCRAHGVWLNIEIKPAPGFEAATGAAVARLTAKMYGHDAARIDARAPLLSSFASEALIAAREAAPDLPRGWLVNRVPPNWRAEVARLGCVSLHANHRHLSAAICREVRRAGIWLFCYTVNSPQRASQILQWGVDAFCTDAIDRIGPDFAATSKI